MSRLNDAKLLMQEMVKQRWEPMGVLNPGAPGLYEQDFLEDDGQVRRVHDLERAVARPEVAR